MKPTTNSFAHSNAFTSPSDYRRLHQSVTQTFSHRAPFARKLRTIPLIAVALCAVTAASLAAQPTAPPPPTEEPAPVRDALRETPVDLSRAALTQNGEPPTGGFEAEMPTVVELGKVAPPSPREPDAEQTSPPQGGDLEGFEPDQMQPTELSGAERGAHLDLDAPPVESASRGASAGSHVREFEGQDDTGSFPPDTVVAVGSRHVVEAVNRGIIVYDKFGNELQSYRSFNNFFSPASGFSLFDPKIIWSNFHNKFALMVLGRNTGSQDSRIYLAISQSSNALGNWWIYTFNAESLGDTDAWLDYASLGGDLWGLYVTGQMLMWDGSGTKHSKLWAISPNAWNGGAINNWVWLDLEWPNGSNARMLEVAHPHTEAFDEATFMVNTYTSSGSDALIWRIVGNRHTAAGLLLSKTQVDIGDYDAIGGNVDQPGSAVDLHGFFAQPNNAVYVNRRVFFSQTTDVNDDGSSSGLLTHRLHVDNATEEWSDLHASGNGRYYFYPGLAFQGTSPENNLALFYSYTSIPENRFASTGFKLFNDQPNSDSGPNQLYQTGLAAYVKLDSFGRNRWGDYGGAAYDWQCGHLWGAAEYAGTGNDWRTRIKAINGAGEGTCSMISVVSPNGGEDLVAGDTVTVDWERQAVPSGTDLFVMYNDGSSTTTLAGPLSTSASSWQWDVPNEPTTEGQIWVGAWDGSTWQLGDWSDLDFTILGLPDFTTQIAAPASAYTGHSIVVPNGISNIGEASGALNVGIALSTNSVCSTSDTLLLQRIGGSLGAGQVNNANSNVTIPAGLDPGNYTLCAIADWSDNVAEFDETNNTSGTPIQIFASELFEDGFESGDVSAWSSSVP